MSADITEQNAANGGELRERYLPVSRKELRRRREAELAAQREVEETPEAGENDAQHEHSTSSEQADSSPDSEPETTAELDEDHAQDELSRAVSATIASESDELPQEPETDDEAEDEPELDSDAAQPLVHGDDSPAEELGPDEEVSDPAVLPEPEEAPARPEEEIADAEADLALDAGEETTQVMSRVLDFPGEEIEPVAEEIVETSSGDEGQAEGNSKNSDVDPDTLPESRRVRRMLRETQSIPPLSPELLAELDSTNAEIARVDDPTSVDPELLKRQQALAAKAMQANQERMRKEHAKAEKDRRRRSRERPESTILTQKMVRDSLEHDPEDMQYATGQIEPVHARGAHGLDLNKMIDATSRQVDRQKVLTWTVIVMAVLLLAAIAAVVYFVFL
ncbi:hypothetical protein [Nesterenkonia haasae]|uniref:hypothetical protein n=1 Tax=Nesterenkonia haasae TaxID=2587813 RepID=UPI001391A10E|nr:hypothetical protein [Nesterenkonia haasae]NDK30563.1 hypothetical protein [Nesterenkonia haasae]